MQITFLIFYYNFFEYNIFLVIFLSIYSVHTLKENADALVAATREIGLEICAE